MSIIYTRKDRCRGCYACVRGCPSKAIKVENQKAEVLPNLCISCGACLRVCSTGAKTVESDIEIVRDLLASDAQVIAVPSSSFPAALPEVTPGQFVSALKKLGFTQVMEDAFGAEMVGREYSRLLKTRKEGPVFSSTCPAVVTFVEKFYPQLVNYLAPVVSPMIAMGRLIKQNIDPRARVVFIGPCVAKKAESRDEHVAGVIDAVLTFTELKEMFSAQGISPETESESHFSGPKPDLGRLFAISAGMLEIAGLSDDILHNEVVNAHGKEYVSSFLEDISQGDVHSHFINFFFCHGCINGPAIDNDKSMFNRRELVARYVKMDADPEQTKRDLEKYSHVSLQREFKARNACLIAPEEKEIQYVLESLGKVRKESQFNCGACGYRNCRELAIAVARKQAEITMCWPHLLTELKDAQEGLVQVEKLSSLGQMAASIAHEINNPLAGVLVYNHLLQKKIHNNSFTPGIALDYLARMETELTRSTKLVRNLLDFARQSPPARRATDLNEVIKRGFELVAHSAQITRIKVIRELTPTLPKLFADPEQLQQVVVNLILNAIQAMPQGGNLTLRTYQDYDQVVLEVTDTGYGISQQNIHKLFTPFFTTKKEVKGVGLGLAVSYGIIQRHRGKISVISKEGEGTTFSIFLPVNYEKKN